MGKLYLILIAIMVFIAVSLSGLFAPPFPKGSNQNYIPDEYKCCDTGDGNDCRPLEELGTITYPVNGHRYALLKSNMYMHDYTKLNLTTEHLNPGLIHPKWNRTEMKLTPPNKTAQFVFYNPSSERSPKRDHPPQCPAGSKGFDRLYGAPAGDKANGCYRIPDEFLIYLCREDSPGDCGGR